MSNELFLILNLNRAFRRDTMKTDKNLCPITLTSTVLILFLLLTLSTSSTAIAQSALPAGSYAYITDWHSGTVIIINTADNNIKKVY